MTKKPAVPPPPSSQKVAFLGQLADVPTGLTSSNFAKEKTAWVDFNFKTKAEFRSLFRLTAARLGISGKDLLVQTFYLWLREEHRKAEKKDTKLATELAEMTGSLEEMMRKDEPV